MKIKNNYSEKDLTFVICAYKQCKYLEECILSLLHQTLKAQIIISTSTPNNFIQNLADKYNIEVRVNTDGGQIKDYNFAMKQPNTQLVMLMHQDEVLSKYFVERVLQELNKASNPIIAFTNYIEMHDDIIDKKPSTLVKIKRLMLLPLYSRTFSSTIFGKRFIQLFGNPITHPTVVCVMKNMPEEIFREKYKASMDWDLWERLSRQKGSFVYVKRVLLCHRMNGDNQTNILLKTSNARYDDELDIFCRFWPKPIAKFILYFYSMAAKYY